MKLHQRNKWYIISGAPVYMKTDGKRIAWRCKLGNILCGTNSTADTKLVTSHRERIYIMHDLICGVINYCAKI